MHIAFWSPSWPLQKNHNGIITYTDQMKRELEARGHRGLDLHFDFWTRAEGHRNRAPSSASGMEGTGLPSFKALAGDQMGCI